MFKAKSEENVHKSMLGFSPPKNGKSTFVFYAPQPTIILNYDGGSPQVPPGAGDDVYVQNYPPAIEDISSTKTSWSRDDKVGGMMIQDIIEIKNAFANKATELTLKNHYDGTPQTIPMPRTIVMDGLVAFNTTLLDWIMGIERIKDPSDVGGDALKFWGKRLDRFNHLLRLLLPLKCNKIFNTWAADEMTTTIGGDGKRNSIPSGRKIPDIGGKLDQWGAGMVDASLYFYTMKKETKTHYYVATKPNKIVNCVGVRGRYDLPEEIDITITSGMNENPWEKIWGKAVKK